MQLFLGTIRGYILTSYSGPSWRFMASYQRGYKSPIMGHNYSSPTYNPIHITNHEPPSTPTIYGLGFNLTVTVSVLFQISKTA